MNRIDRRRFLYHTAAGAAAMSVAGTQRLFGAEPNSGAFDRAAQSAKIAGYSISKVQRWLYEKALPLIDEKTGLYKADGRWIYRDTAADCYPFFCWAAHLTDREALYGPVLQKRLATYEHAAGMVHRGSRTNLQHRPGQQ